MPLTEIRPETDDRIQIFSQHSPVQLLSDKVYSLIIEHRFHEVLNAIRAIVDEQADLPSNRELQDECVCLSVALEDAVQAALVVEQLKRQCDQSVWE